MEQIRILLVEDNPLDVRLLREALKALNGHQPIVTNVSRLDEALARLRSDPFDIVLLDLSLPDSEGFDTLEQLHAAAPDKPIVVLTGYDDDRFAVRAVQEGAQDYLVKGEMDGGVIMRSVRYAIERARTLTELRQSEERYRLLAENVRDVIWTADTDLNMTFVSPSVYLLQGFTPEEMVGRSVADIISPESLELVKQIYAEEMAARQSDTSDMYRSRTLEIELRHKNGTMLWVEITATLLRDSQGRIIGFTGVSRDISERKRNARIQSVLYQIAEATTASQDLGSLLTTIRRKLGRLIDTTNFYVALYDEEKDQYEFPCFWDQCDMPPESPRQMPNSLTDLVRRIKTPLLMDPEKHRELAESGKVEPYGTSA
ncbi:PAS domain S-box protein, partial [candidate division KSB1 bacterium]